MTTPISPVFGRAAYDLVVREETGEPILIDPDTGEELLQDVPQIVGKTASQEA